MCGLVGVVGNYTNRERMFRILLYLDVLRGNHSTGVAIRVKTPEDTYNTKIYKVEGGPENLNTKFPAIFDENFGVNLQRGRLSFMMGHNRYATVGGTTTANAHPFHQRNIIGAHNGTIRSGLEKLGVNKADLKGATDSEQLYAAMGSGKSLKEIVDSVNGAMALTWYNMADNTFHIYRNSERPLYFAISSAKNFLVYASEDWMIKAAADKAKNPELAARVQMLPVNCHMTFHIDDNLSIDKIEEEVISKSAAPLVQHKSPVPVIRVADVIPFKDHGKSPMLDQGDWYAMEIEEERDFLGLTQAGCAMCSTDLTWEDYKAGKVFWVNDNICFCETCAKKFGDSK